MPELAAQVRSVFAFVNGRPPGELGVRAFNPDPDRDGWSASGSVVDVNVEDSPFLVDTVTAELHDFGCQVRLVLHPVMGVERAADGTIEAVTPARGAPRRESVMHFQTDRTLDDAGLEAVEDALRRASRAAARRSRLPADGGAGRADDRGRRGRGRALAPDEMHESIEFLSWLTDDNFIYLGYREYEATEVDGQAAAGIVAGIGPGPALGRGPVPLRADAARFAMKTP